MSWLPLVKGSHMSGVEEPRKYRVVYSQDLPFAQQMFELPDRSLHAYVMYKLAILAKDPRNYSFNISDDYQNQEYWVHICDKVAIYFFLVEQIVVPFFIRRHSI
jgi:hypothetical protein